MDQTVYTFRRNVMPNRISEYPLFLFISLVIPITYWFEMWVVAPYLFADNPVFFWIAFLVVHFVLHNVVGNFLGIIMNDTSIRGRKMPGENEPGVLYCSVCETHTPPRSYHCPCCDICILKRDHHCIFTGCCVGFYNHRFFFFFIFYMMLSTMMSLPFNVYFLWNVLPREESLLCAIVFPLFFLFYDLQNEDFNIQHVYLLITILGGLGIILSSVWLLFHLKLILKGTLIHEMRKCINIYNLGKDKNLEMVFGKRWHFSWISPYVKSPLICDGITFPVNENDKVD